MSTTINTYPVFENNQVLTSSQLNELEAYLDQQTRLSRVRLVGIGAVCGLYPSFTSDNPNSTPPANTGTLTISAGTGITSEGYLINTGDADMTQYRPYTIPASFPYTPFIDTSNNEQVTLYEMLPASFVAPVGDPNIPVRITKTFLDGATPGEKKIALLFVEIVRLETKTCLGKSCDSGGSEETHTLRKLLISVNELQIVLRNTGEFTLDFPAKFDLPELKVQRAIFDPLAQTTRDYIAFSQQYRAAAGYVYRQNVADPMGVINALKQTYTIFEPLLKDIYGNTNPFDPFPNFTALNNFINGINSVSQGPAYFGIQYFYDFIKDLLLAYNEFRDAAFTFMSDCCLDMRLFPQHLLLGEAVPVNDCKPSRYRDDFIAVPLTPEQRNAKNLLLTYFARMVLMARKFNVALVHNPNTGDLAPITRITPSFEKISKLSERSIPYYYKIDEIDTQLNTTLEAVWNFELVKRCRKDAFGQFPIVAYWNQALNQNAPIDPVQTPLLFDIDQYNFLRVEGHFRKPVDDVIDDLETKKVQFNLPFNVMKVRLKGAGSQDEILKRCNFDDLRSQYFAYRNEFACRAARLLDYVTTKDPAGKDASAVIPKPFPDFINKLIEDSEKENRGNSSVKFMPTVFQGPNGQTARAVKGLLTYAPRSLFNVTSDYFSNVYALITRFQIIKNNSLLANSLDQFEYGYTNRNVDTSFINSYLDSVLIVNNIKADINELLDHVWHNTLNIYPAELYFTLSVWASENISILNQYLRDCSFRKLEALYYEFQYRLNYFLKPENDPTLFANFIASNPGADHKAGVPVGGTLVLVHPGEAMNFSIQTVGAITAQLQETKALQVELVKLEAEKARTNDQEARMAFVQNQLCTIYAAEATSPRPKPRPSGFVTPSLALQQIRIGADDVIADFALPYLSNCSCECKAIPSPTLSDLKIPSVAFPVFFEYNLGDYAFAKNITASTYGCVPATQITIDVSSHINFGGGGDGSRVRLKFVVNGTDMPGVATQNPNATIRTTRGATVRITQGNGIVQGFLYTPPTNFTGLDTFNYVFEVYDNQGNITCRSNMSTVMVSLTRRCTTQNPAANGQIQDTIALTR